MPSASIEPARGPTRRAVGLSLLGLALAPGLGRAQDPRFLRIATGTINGTYYPVGELIAGLISSPPGARDCAQAGGGCGVPGLIAVVQTSKGSVENVAAIQEGRVESGFVQGDVASGAFTGNGVFAGAPAMDRLRALASLYRESVHLVVRAGSGIDGLAGLRGRRVSLDVEGSGTLVVAREILAGWGMSPADLEPVHAPLGRSLDLVRSGGIDAFFLVAGYPAAAITELAGNGAATLAPIAGPEIGPLLQRHRFFTADLIPAEAYPGVGRPVPTLGVAALWVVNASLDEALAYEITGALWHPSAREALDRGHPKGAAIRLETALQGVGIPLHPGAARFYREQGVAE
jgi:hypothetical protein